MEADHIMRYAVVITFVVSLQILSGYCRNHKVGFGKAGSLGAVFGLSFVAVLYFINEFVVSRIGYESNNVDLSSILVALAVGVSVSAISCIYGAYKGQVD
ncbi:hypothetical protein IMCC21906_02836 [Spongiibacter sp. IMCC21906]|nr:hypothetical protein IMCC21906_02836 [Spongiibacter sp. IMCC21906]